MLQASLRASELTQQLLSFGRRQTIRPRAIPVDDLVQEAARLLIRIVPEQVQLDFETNCGDWRVKVDPTHLHQVITNLVVNASQAVDRGGRVQVFTRRDSSAEGDRIAIAVRDDGPGIPADLRDRIFEPFYTTKEVGEGTGLGLSVARGIVQQHGGHIALECPDGGGCTFTVSLPRTLDRDDEASEAIRPEPMPRDIRVLLVEDEEMVRVLSQRILEEAGIEVIGAANGEEGLAIIGEQAIDLVITDVIMPRMTGPEMVRRLRRTRPTLRALFVSGYPADIVDGRVKFGEHDGFLPKPFKSDQLYRAVAGLLHRP